MDEASGTVAPEGAAVGVSQTASDNGRVSSREAREAAEVDCTEAAVEKARPAAESLLRKSLGQLLRFLVGALASVAVSFTLLYAVFLITAASFTTRLVLGVSAAVSLTVVILWKIPKWQVSYIKDVAPNVKFELENEARRTLAQILAGVVVLTGIYGTYRTLNVSEQAQMAERYNKAVGQLGSESLTLKLGAVYALESISEDSAGYRGRVFQMLNAYVKENASLKNPAGQPSPTPASPKQSQDVKQETIFRTPRADIQAALDALIKLSAAADASEKLSINLAETDLYGARFLGANNQDVNLHRANFYNAELSRANFVGATLTEANFVGANLKDANFFLARLQQAEFFGADLEGADLDGADLEGADLRGTSGLTAEQLKGAVNVEKARLPAALADALGIKRQ